MFFGKSFGKKVAISLVALSVSALSLPAMANLTITNYTNEYSTANINGACSATVLGAHGITNPNSTNSVPDIMVQKLCGYNPNNCVATIYVTNNCTGDAIAAVTLNASAGSINGITNQSSRYVLTQTGQYAIAASYR